MKCSGPNGCPRDDCDGRLLHAPTANWPTRWVCDACGSIVLRQGSTDTVEVFRAASGPKA